MNKLLLDVEKYPYLRKYGEVETLAKRLMSIKQQLNEQINSARIDCEHVFEEKHGNFLTNSFEKPLIAKQCKSCGYAPQKPTGSNTEVCDCCWGEMKFSHERPGQGCRFSYFKCINCGHQDFHT